MFERGSRVRGALLLVAALLLIAACGGNGATAVAPPPPASTPETNGDGSQPPSGGADSASEALQQSRPAAGASPAETAPPPPSDPEPPAAAGGRVGADLADTLPTVSTMAQSSAPLPPPETADGGTSPEGIEGVVVVPVTSAEHVRYDVEYPTAPPAGGPHLGIWLNCGFYTVPVLDELAVHSLEHGAVWVTYRSDVSTEALSELQLLAAQSSHLLVSPYESQGSPLVLSAWARQLHLDSLGDPRFERFLEVYLFDGPTVPEPGAACSGAVGVPPEHPEAVPQQG